ncbi:MAG TPA: hypothetical protein VKT00_08875, partial [Casimicrobiaceae bacterium]|nr:hypothetical protein [Casimicrobiaceae bacterium]
ALIVFACVFAGALSGMALRASIPEQHLSDASKSVIQLATGLVATMAALVLGLMTASVKTSYDAQSDAIKHGAAKILVLDTVLASYGPESRETRALLRKFVRDRVDAVWSQGRSRNARLDVGDGRLPVAELESHILQLSPQNEMQRWLRSQALQISADLSETRWLILGELQSAVPGPFIAVVIFWLTMIFASFGLFAPRNGTVIGALCVSALSVAGAIFLILEMGEPFEGIMRVSSAPLRYAIAHIGQ